MEYTNEDVRRQDRLLDEPRAKEIMSTAEYGVLSMADPTGMPYGIPLNFVWDGNDCFYVHCAPEGRKLRMISENKNVSFCIVGNVALKPQLFTTAYESVVLSGEASVVDSDKERREALRLLVKKFSPEHEALGAKYSEKSFHRVAILKIKFNKFSGKCKQVK